jgi:hypothetical protein
MINTANTENDPFNRSDMEKIKERIANNSLTDSLLPWDVDEVNGPRTEEITGYTPTRHELIHLVKYWCGEVLDLLWDHFTYGQACSSDSQRISSARRRINLAATVIGDEAVDQAIAEVRAEFKEKVNDARLWDLIENGTPGQWEAVADESWREVLEKYATDAQKRLEQLQKESPSDFCALVLIGGSDHEGTPALISTTNSELNAPLQASGKFRIEADVSTIRALMLDQRFQKMGFLRATRRDRRWAYEFPDSSPGTIGWSFLKEVTHEIERLLHNDTEHESSPV